MLIPVSMQHVKDASTVLAYQCYVGHGVPFSNQGYAGFVTDRYLSVTRVNFICVFFDNPGYFGDPGHGEPDHKLCKIPCIVSRFLKSYVLVKFSVVSVMFIGQLSTTTTLVCPALHQTMRTIFL